MAVIKSNHAASLLKEAIVLDLGDLGRQAAQIVASAQAKATRLVADAEKKAAQLTANASNRGLEEGKSKGYQDGLTKGLAEGRKKGQAEGHAEVFTKYDQQLQAVQKAWIEAGAQFDAHRQNFEQEAKQAVLDIALRMAEKLVHRAIEVDPTIILDQVAVALEHVLRPTDLRIQICPEDRPVLEEALPQLMAEFPKLKHVRLVDDPAVRRGGCVLSYGQGAVDATIDTQLRRVVELILPGDREESQKAEVGSQK